MAIELVTYASLKALLDLESALITDYPALNIIRPSVTSAIEEYLDRSLEPIERTETIYIGSFKTSMLRLPAIPITSIASVTVTIGEDSETYDEHDEYEITEYGLKLLVSLSNAKVVVVYTGGVTVVPDAIARAALLQTAYEFQSKDHIGADNVSTEGGSVSRPAIGLLKEVRRMLDKFKHPLMGA
ncbi:MAG: hypothetical protein ABIJ16_07320 [Bacteroidota bacterium]